MIRQPLIKIVNAYFTAGRWDRSAEEIGREEVCEEIVPGDPLAGAAVTE